MPFGAPSAVLNGLGIDISFERGKINYCAIITFSFHSAIETENCPKLSVNERRTNGMRVSQCNSDAFFTSEMCYRTLSMASYQSICPWYLMSHLRQWQNIKTSFRTPFGTEWPATNWYKQKNKLLLIWKHIVLMFSCFYFRGIHKTVHKQNLRVYICNIVFTINTRRWMSRSPPIVTHARAYTTHRSDGVQCHPKW